MLFEDNVIVLWFSRRHGLLSKTAVRNINLGVAASVDITYLGFLTISHVYGWITRQYGIVIMMIVWSGMINWDRTKILQFFVLRDINFSWRQVSLHKAIFTVCRKTGELNRHAMESKLCHTREHGFSSASTPTQISGRQVTGRGKASTTAAAVMSPAGSVIGRDQRDRSSRMGSRASIFIYDWLRRSSITPRILSGLRLWPVSCNSTLVWASRGNVYLHVQEGLGLIQIKRRMYIQGVPQKTHHQLGSKHFKIATVSIHRFSPFLYRWKAETSAVSVDLAGQLSRRWLER